MKLRVLFVSVMTLITCVSFAQPELVGQQGGGKGKPPATPNTPGIAEILCIANEVLCDDGGGPYANGVDSLIVDLRTSSDGNFRLNTGVGPRTFTVRIPPRNSWDFQDCAAPCVADIDPNNGLEISAGWDNTYVATFRNGGLANLPIGVTLPTKAAIGFPDPDPSSAIRWSLYFDPEYYAGTEYAEVTRTDACNWTIRAENKLAGFWLFRVGKGAKGNVQEGRFRTSFHITFTASGCTPSRP